MKKLVTLASAVFLGFVASAHAAGDAKHPKAHDWSFEGFDGHFDRAALQRGFQVYKDVCAACHGLKYIAFRNLAEIGFSEAEYKAIAAEYIVTDGPDDFGDMFERPAIPSDYFPSPFANDEQARASNNGALPPDLSLITKARADGANYMHALLTGYEDPPADVEMTEGLTYNPYFSGGQIAMVPPLMDDLLEYADGTPATVEQMSEDVVTFLHWAAEPKMEARKKLGSAVMVFLAVMTILLYLANKKMWASVKGKKDGES